MSQGNAILKELIQNADDAGNTVPSSPSRQTVHPNRAASGARRVKFCLDMRSHGVETLAYEKLAEFQGPAIYAYNDAVFTDTDFASIQHIGDSRKKESVVRTTPALLPVSISVAAVGI